MRHPTNWWVGDVSKNYGAASNTPVIDCDTRGGPTPCRAVNPNADDDVANVRAIKTIVAAITPPPTPAPTPKAWFSTHAFIASAITTSGSYAAFSGMDSGGLEAGRDSRMPAAGECDRMALDIHGTTLAADETITATLRVAGSGTTLTCSVTSAGDTCDLDLGGSPATWTSNQHLAWKVICSGAGCPTASLNLGITARCRFT